MTNPIRIVVADDHPVVRDGLISILGTQADFVVVGQAGNGRHALEQAEQSQPDLMLLDLEMPEGDGVEVIEHLSEVAPHTRVIVFTAFDTDDRILSALEAGAQGYLLKGAPRDELFNAVRVVHAGGSLLQPIVASKLLRRVTDSPESPDLSEDLTPRELDVLRELAKGLQNKEIAAELFITERTVKFHVSSILGKLGAGNRTEAVAIAAQGGLIEL